ncbi:VanZ family protein [Lacticigenium naphthae]|uniref:VanZ family protein n=1 Tax=Lacticigenium naphthae TaxID=515351 RepID=UPI00040E2F5D|nr:VanZ family protein [Lacticigenium naphthae]
MKRKKSQFDNIYILLAFAVMIILFQSSSMTYGEQNITSTLDNLLAGQPLLSILKNIEFHYAGNLISIEALGYSSFIEFILRKGVHFTSYFLLGLLWFLGLRNKTSSLPLAMLLSILLAVGYASFDEFHQMLTPQRTPLLEDIILDGFGALTGVIIGWLATKK